MKVYRIDTPDLGTLHVVRVPSQPFQHPSEVHRRETYEQSTPGGTVILGPRLLTGLSEQDVIAAGGVLIQE